MARHADIWHSFDSLAELRRKDAIVKRLAERADRGESRIERATAWVGPDAADAFYSEGVTLFTTEVKPTEDGYDLGVVEEMIAWRDGRQSLR